MSVGAGKLASASISSGNAKIGDAATTYAAQVSCPSSCVFSAGGGCYAETGRVGKFVTAPLNAEASKVSATPLEVALEEAEAIDSLPTVSGRPLRLHTVGDCKTDETARIVSAAAERYMERGGGPVWTYTHAWATVERASWGRVSVLASCETSDQIEAARSRGYAPSVVVEEFPTNTRYQSVPLGTEVLPCPAQTAHVNCSTCRLCMNDGQLLERGYAIGFELHGIPYAIRQARLALRTPDDPDRRMPSEERIRLIREHYLSAEEPREPTVREVAELIDLNPASVYEWLRFLRDETEHPAKVRRLRDERKRRSLA